ncbi:MAG: hypothetical protein N3D19_04965 [Archaeoglobaceae archaeon]|nr:hypothetical protein [Archaeoglobaceae archaeon]
MIGGEIEKIGYEFLGFEDEEPSLKKAKNLIVSWSARIFSLCL